MDSPAQHRSRIRTNNTIERLSREIKRLKDNWDAISPIFKLSATVRRGIYTTNALELLNSTCRKLNPPEKRICERYCPFKGVVSDNLWNHKKVDFYDPKPGADPLWTGDHVWRTSAGMNPLRDRYLTGDFPTCYWHTYDLLFLPICSFLCRFVVTNSFIKIIKSSWTYVNTLDKKSWKVTLLF